MNRGWQQLQERLLSTATIIRRGNTFARQPNIWLWALAFLHIHALMPPGKGGLVMQFAAQPT
ncbi:putative tail fiber assembly protein [Escherichia coli]|nr:putative tail fiber assembly protein [Escherichia coli]